MKESNVESKLVNTLHAWGFEVLKLTTPGTSGVMDRLILMPTWSPAPPAFIELKAPGKHERPLQAAKHGNWIARGANVLDMASTLETVQERCDDLITVAVIRYCKTMGGGWGDLPQHIRNAYVAAADRIGAKRKGNL